MADATKTQRPFVFGVLNVTPDSFSDGGRFIDAGAAIARGRDLVRSGADVIDVGGESTRPGAERVSPEEELERVLPVVQALVATGMTVSVDTMRASTAAEAIAAGASYINDVSGGLADPDMARVVASAPETVRYIAMHWRGHSDRMDQLTRYTDVVEDVIAELSERVASLQNSGIARERLIIDPGFGFAKNAEQNWTVLSNLDQLHRMQLPMLVGVSRKRFLADVLPETADALDRDLPTAVVSALAAERGAWAVRVHDVAGTKAALEVAARMRHERQGL